MAEIEKKNRCYPTDLTDAQWLLIQPLLPSAANHGRKPKVDMREMLKAIRYMTCSAGGWRMLHRERVGREAGPTGGVVDSQIVKALSASVRGMIANANGAC